MMKPLAKNPLGSASPNSSSMPAFEVKKWSFGGAHQKWYWKKFFIGLDKVLKRVVPLFPERPAAARDRKADAFVTERLNGEDGLGAIFPAMVNSLEMYDALGVPAERSRASSSRASRSRNC